MPEIPEIGIKDVGARIPAWQACHLEAPQVLTITLQIGFQRMFQVALKREILSSATKSTRMILEEIPSFVMAPCLPQALDFNPGSVPVAQKKQLPSS